MKEGTKWETIINKYASKFKHGRTSSQLNNKFNHFKKLIQQFEMS